MQSNEDLARISFSYIGVVRSCFPEKRGCPRQGLALCPGARGRLCIDKSLEPRHLLDQLVSTHIWLIFVFHKNNNPSRKPKVAPPRAGGRRVGVYASRSPYRPNPIGLTLCKIERIDAAKGQVLLTGVDVIDGTPVLDIKPYVPEDCITEAAVAPSWLPDTYGFPLSTVRFSESADRQLMDHVTRGKLKFFGASTKEYEAAALAIRQVIATDPRSVYQQKLGECTMGVCFDKLNVIFSAVEGGEVIIESVEYWSAETRLARKKETDDT